MERASEERFTALVQHSSDIVVIEGPDAVSRYVSPAIQRVLGYAPEAFVGNNTCSYVHPDDLPRIQVLFRTLAAQPGCSVSAGFRARHASGSRVHIEATATNLLDHPQIQGLVVHARDITDRTRAEEAVRQRDAELAHVLRVTTMGELAAGLAHEINQPLAAIVNYAKGCARRLVGDGEKTDGLRADPADWHRGRAVGYRHRPGLPWRRCRAHLRSILYHQVEWAGDGIVHQPVDCRGP